MDLLSHYSEVVYNTIKAIYHSIIVSLALKPLIVVIYLIEVCQYY